MKQPDTFISRLTRTPHAFEAERGADALAALPRMAGELRDLIAGTGGSSPYLAGLIASEADWIAPVLKGAPETAFGALLAEAGAAGPDDAASVLRQVKRRAALLIALADLGGIWALEEVTGALTRLADVAAGTALRAALLPDLRRGRVPGVTEEMIDGFAGMTVLAMGKMGAFELNYSSDIDLIVLFDESLYERDVYLDARSALIRATRKMAATLNDQTAEGYVFRTDLRLRPDASVTPVCLSMTQAETYYESVGRTWERAAYIKARAAAGDIGAGERFLKVLTPFVWRKHLDYAAIQDAHDMRLRIRDHKGLHAAPSHLGHNLKLGIGGIREIEFFTQTRQLIAGGRDPSLRVRGTVPGLMRLGQAGWVGAEEAAVLTADYQALRELEHRVQMVHDQQTHDLPGSEEGFARLAALCGMAPEALRDETVERLRRVHALTEAFFAPGKPRAAASVDLDERQAAMVEKWQSYPALRSNRAREIFARIRPVLIERIMRAGDPTRALAHIDAFLAGLPAGVQVFSLFDANPQLLDLVADIADTTPELARYLARNAGVFDAVIGGAFFGPWPGWQDLAAGLAGAMDAEADYERRLDRARVWKREWHFRTGVHFLRGLIDAEEAGRQYADLARAVLAALWPVVAGEFARRHGPEPGRGAAVLGMGSLGAGALTPHSDLDLIVIYDAAGAEESAGPKPLPVGVYFARLTQAFLTAISAPTSEGRLYEVDMRLRPSGRQGPVATSLASFTDYQQNQAWTWEHMALTRACPVAGSAALGAEIEAFRQDLLEAPRSALKVLGDVAEMRARLAEARPGAGTRTDKAGRGRLQDIELMAQAAALMAGSSARETAAQLAEAGRIAGLSAAEVTLLSDAHRVMWAVRAAEHLATGEEGHAGIGAESGAARLILRGSGAESLTELDEALASQAEAVAAAIDRVLETSKDD